MLDRRQYKPTTERVRTKSTRIRANQEILSSQQPVIRLLAQTKGDLDGVRRDGLVPVEGPQRFHAFGLSAQPLIAIPNNRRHQLLAPRVFVARFQRLVARAPEIQHRVVDRRRLCACNRTTIVSNNFQKKNNFL